MLNNLENVQERRGGKKKEEEEEGTWHCKIYCEKMVQIGMWKKKKKLTNICVSVLKTSFEIYDHNMLYDSVGK